MKGSTIAFKRDDYSQSYNSELEVLWIDSWATDAWCLEADLWSRQIFEVDKWNQPCITVKVLQTCGFADGDLRKFMRRFGCLGKQRYKTIDLEHGCNKGCHWKGMVGFNFFHFLSVEVISLKGSHMNWWFRCNPFLRWEPIDLRVTQVVQIQRSLAVAWDTLVGRMCGELGRPTCSSMRHFGWINVWRSWETYLDESCGGLRNICMHPWRWLGEDT
jgi:hypothetical protein